MASFFEDLNDNIIDVESMLLASTPLCKLLQYSGATDIEPLTKADFDHKTLRMKNLFPMPKMPDVQSDRKAIVSYYFMNGKPQRRNTGFRNVYLCFDVICHLDSWLIKDGIRPYSICAILDRMFNGQFIGELSGNDVFSADFTHMRYGDYFYGYRLIYQLGKESNVGLCE